MTATNERYKVGRRTRRVLIGLGIVATSAVAVFVAAHLDMARERKAREYLGDQLFTDIRGDGDPVVFIPGLQASTRFWGSAFDDLAKERRLVFIDTLGFGRSPWPENSAYDLEDQLTAIRRTLVAKKVTGKVTIVAHSFGTVLAANYAARYPEEVSRVVLLGTPVFANANDGKKQIRGMSKIAALFTFNRSLANIACMTMCAFRPVLQRVLPSLRPELDPDVARDAVLHVLPAVDGSVNILLGVPVVDALRQLGTKATLVHGARDTVTPLAQVRLTTAETGARLIEVPGTHHQYFSEGIGSIRDAILEDGTDI